MKWLWSALGVLVLLAALAAIGLLAVRSGPTGAVPATDPVARLNAEHANLEGNAASHYEKATAALHGRMPASLELRRVPRDPEMRRIASEWVEANADALAHAMEGAAEPRLWIDLPSDWTGLFGQRSKHREVAKLIVARAWLALADADVKQATESLLAADSLGKQFARLPTVFDQLMAIAVRALAQDLVLAPLAVDPNAVPDIAAYAAALEPCFEPTTGLATALRNEAELSAWDYANGVAGASGGLMRAIAPATRFSGEQQRVLQPILGLLELPVECWTDPNQPLVIEARALAATPPNRWNVAGVLTHPVVESHLGIVALAARFTAVQRGHWTALQVLRIAAERGAPPASLDALQGDARVVDPFSGRPFAYRVDGNTFTLYSFGPDRDDDGGRRQDRTCRLTGTAGPPDGDLVFWPLEE